LLATVKQRFVALVFGVTLVTVPVAVQAQVAAVATPQRGALPLLGDGGAMASADERRLGDRIARELYRDPDYLDDPVLADYVQGVWQPLLAAARARGDLSPELDERFAWRILLGRDRSVNAFALPGGYLGVHLGLLGVVSSRDELASVLGHELSHVTQRHISRLIARDAQQTPWMIGAMILGMLAASKSVEGGQALLVGGQALAAQGQLNFSRDMEREADRIGLAVMAQAGFQAQGFVTMFDKLQQAARLNDSGAYPYLRSHPLTTERIADVQSRLPLGAPHPAAPEPTMLHAMMTTRAKVLSNTGADALRSWQAVTQDSALTTQSLARQAGAWYGASLAAVRLREVAVARRHCQQLLALVGTDPEALARARWLQAEIELTAHDLTRPQVRALADDLAAGLPATATSDWRRPALLLQAQAAHQGNQNDVMDAAAQRLQSWLALQPQDALAWQWLASLRAAQGQSLPALRGEAEAQAARLDYSGALDRLKAAQDHFRTSDAGHSSGDLIEASIVDARVRQLEALLREQSATR